MPRGRRAVRLPRGTRSTVRRAADRLLRCSPAQVYFHRVGGQRLAVLAYHGVEDPARLAEHLDRVLEVGTPVSLDQVLAAGRTGRRLPPRSVLVTFDDGHRSVLEAGLPVLQARGAPAVAFVVPGLLDTDEPFWWTEVEHLVRHGGRAARERPRSAAAWVSHLKTLSDARRREVLAELRATAAAPCPPQPQLRSVELAALQVAGVAVGNHTWSHPCLDRCDDATVAAELRAAHDRLTEVLGEAPRAFAYPNGNWDARADRWLRSAGYRLAFLFDHSLADPAMPDPLRVSRLRVGTETSGDRFAVTLSGLHPALHRARGGR